MAEHCLEGVTVISRDGQVLYASPSTADLLGRPLDEIVGRLGWSFVHPDDLGQLLARHAECVRSPGSTFSLVFRIVRPGGDRRWIHTQARNLFDNPDVRAIVATFVDVTDAREAEDRQREALETFSRAIEQCADGILITSPRGTIEYVNPAFEKMCGYGKDELLGRTPHVLASGQTRPDTYRRMWERILSGRSTRLIIVNRRKDGQLYHHDQTISPLYGPDGAITHFVSTGRDTSALKRAEMALRRLNARAEEEATRLAGVVHDEAGQLLSAVHLMLAELSSEVSLKTSARLDEVRSRLYEVEEQLRRVSHELHPRIVEDEGLLEGVEFLADGFARRTGIPIAVESSLADTSRPLDVDVLLYRVVQEALRNVARHARASSVQVSLTSGEESVECAIRDNGIGLEAAASHANGSGAGLGLRIMKDRVEASGGTLTITSGSGTELRVTVRCPCDRDAIC